MRVESILFIFVQYLSLSLCPLLSGFIETRRCRGPLFPSRSPYVDPFDGISCCAYYSRIMSSILIRMLGHFR